MPATKVKPLTLTFAKSKETRRTWRFQETGDPDNAIVGNIYVQKSALTELGDPDTITVTVTPSE